MTVLCANCHTANRDRAMFCIGCAGKLPAFAATGPSALETVRGKQRPGKVPDGAAAVPQQAGTPAPHAPRGLMVAVLLLGATVVALAAWISFGPERAAAPGLASAAAPPLQTLPATAVAAPAAVAIAPPVQVPLESALSPGESAVPVTPPVAAAPAVASAPAAAKPPVTTPGRTSTTRSAGDPRTGCEHLFFVLAARCEAEHCEQAAYARHPRCEAVREQRRRDEARRNPMGG